MRRALTALSGDDENLRGTALEYLDEVLPSDVKADHSAAMTCVSLAHFLTPSRAPIEAARYARFEL